MLFSPSAYCVGDVIQIPFVSTHTQTHSSDQHLLAGVGIILRALLHYIMIVLSHKICRTTL